MVNQEYLIQLSMIEQEANKFEEKLKIIEQQSVELQTLQLSLDEIKESTDGKILAGLGKGIYLETEVKNKDVFVNVGGNTILKKSIDETKNIIGEQIQKLEKAKKEVVVQILGLQERTREIIDKARQEMKKDK